MIRLPVERCVFCGAARNLDSVPFGIGHRKGLAAAKSGLAAISVAGRRRAAFAAEETHLYCCNLTCWKNEE
eukprot:scaffold395853_cov70-Cyclotella_meneghiniana.AAC.2